MVYLKLKKERKQELLLVAVLILLEVFFFVSLWFFTSNKTVRSQETYKGYVTFWFDDGMKTTYDDAYPMLKEKGWPAVLAVIADRSSAVEKYENQQDILTWEEVTMLQSDGWEISNHSLTHSHLNENLDKGFLNSEISISLNLLREKGFDVNSFTSPYGEQGYEIGQSIVNGKYKYWRSMEEGINTVPAQRYLTVYFLGSDTTVEQVDEWLKETESTKGWLIVGLQSTMKEPATRWDHTPEQLKMLIKKVNSSSLKVVTPKYMFDTFGYAQESVVQ